MDAHRPIRTHDQRLAPVRRRGIAHRLPGAFAERKRRDARTRHHDLLDGEHTHNVESETVDGACTQDIGDVALSPLRNLSTTLRHRRLRFTEQSLLLWMWMWQVG